MAGRPPKPTQIKRLEGNPGQRPLNENEPEYGRDDMTAPAELLSDIARDEWDRISRELARANMWQNTDRAALVSYCLAWEQLVRAYEIVKVEGICTTNDKGVPIRNPATTMLREAMDQINRYSQQFGFTPASRSRIQAKRADDGDEFEQWHQDAKAKAKTGT